MTCIQSSFQCDCSSDCDDGSDEDATYAGCTNALQCLAENKGGGYHSEKKIVPWISVWFPSVNFCSQCVFKFDNKVFVSCSWCCCFYGVTLVYSHLGYRHQFLIDSTKDYMLYLFLAIWLYLSLPNNPFVFFDLSSNFVSQNSNSIKFFSLKSNVESCVVIF